MKQPEYIEGPEALGNFERGMIALFKVPKPAVVTVSFSREGHREQLFLVSPDQPHIPHGDHTPVGFARVELGMAGTNTTVYDWPMVETLPKV